MITIHGCLSVLVLCALAIGIWAPVLAEEPVRTPGARFFDEQHWTLGIPLWIPGYRGALAIGEIEISGETSGGSGFFERFFDSELSVNYFFMGSATCRYGRWRFHGEVFGGKFTDDVTFKLTNGKVISAGVRPVVPRAVAAYRVREYNLGDPGRWAIQVWGATGLRYYDVAVDAVVAGQTFGVDDEWVDPLVGVWLPTYLSRKWCFELEADVGGFGVGSRLSWQVQAHANYLFNNLVSAGVGFSLLDVDYRGTVGSERFTFESKVLGPRASLLFNF